MATPTASPDPGFTPRKEFIRQHKSTSNSFALLAIANTNLIRFYSFPRVIVSHLRRLLETKVLLVAFREDISHNFCEFTIDGKPWTNGKSVQTERLLVDILSVIYQCGFEFLSTIDYGREHDDRLAMAFSKPNTTHSGSRSGTPLPPSPSPQTDGSGSYSSHTGCRRAPFAISFTSATLMRVISPPLHLTPAILQAVRGSWPRGVVSEKKVDENSFEFKLKGYKWFQQDTFATDSLRHILTLLSSLDTHSFTLLSSISLSTNRSRVKDLWIFTGPASSSIDGLLEGSPTPSILNSSHGEIKRQPFSEASTSHIQTYGSLPQHRRQYTEPWVSASDPSSSQHIRSVSDEQNGRSSPGQRKERYVHTTFPPSSPSGLLRKPAPRAQVPISVVNEPELSSEGFRAILPSVVSSDNENMTGVGAGLPPRGYYPLAMGLEGRPITPVASTSTHHYARGESATSPNRAPLLPVSARSKTPPLLTSKTSSRSTPRNPISRLEEQRDLGGTSASVQESPRATPPLLGSGAFRDSAYSSNSGASYDVPIKWTGIGDQKQNSTEKEIVRPKSSVAKPSMDNRTSPSPILPGGWRPSPIEERMEEENNTLELLTSNHSIDRGTKTPIHEVGSRVASPELNEPDATLRKSEAALIGMVAETMPPKSKEPSGGSGQGWVLVNVEGMNSPLFAESDSLSPVARSPASQSMDNAIRGPNTLQHPSSGNATMSPEAKTIAIIDALDANNRAKQNGSPDGTSLRKRFFNLGRKNSKKAPRITDGLPSGNDRGPTKSRSGFRDKLRLSGPPEAPRNEDKRRSLD